MANNIFNDLYKMFSMGTIITHKGRKGTSVIDVNTRDRQSVEAGDFEGYRGKLFYKGVVDDLNTGRHFRFNKLELYKDYEEMDRDPIISSALDLYSEESSVKNEYDEVLSIKTDNKEIQDHLYELFYERLNIEFNLSAWIRNLAKYGDHFLALDISTNDGVIAQVPLSAYSVEKIQGTTQNPYEVFYKVSNINKRFENYEVLHFTYIGDGNFAPYGRSLIENSRKVWKMLSLMEDAMLIHRIIRAPEKRVFKIDVGNLTPQEVDPYMDRIMNQIRRTPYYDPQTGDYNLKFSMQNITEDFFFAVRGGENGTSIESIGGLEYTAIDDIEYLKKKLLASLRIPAPFLVFEESVGSKATLAAEDLRFARTISKIQRVVESELRKVAQIHLYILGYRGEDLRDYDLKLTNPSIIYEQEKIALLDSKTALAGNIKGLNMFSDSWIYKNIFGISESDIDRERLALTKEAGFSKKLDSVRQEGLESELSSNEEDENKYDEVDENEKFEEPEEFENEKSDEESSNESSEEEDVEESTDFENRPPKMRKVNNTGSRELHNNGLRDNSKDPLGIKDYKNQRKRVSLSSFLGISESSENEIKNVKNTKYKIHRSLDEPTVSKLNEFLKINNKMIIEE